MELFLKPWSASKAKDGESLRAFLFWSESRGCLSPGDAGDPGTLPTEEGAGWEVGKRSRLLGRPSHFPAPRQPHPRKDIGFQLHIRSFFSFLSS